MASLNRVILVGYCSEVKSNISQSGALWASFNIVLKEKFKGEENVTFLPVKVFGKNAEYCTNYVSKGNIVCVEGKISNNTWENKQGIKVTRTEIIANRVSNITYKPKPSDQQPESAFEADTFDERPIDPQMIMSLTADDIPF